MTLQPEIVAYLAENPDAPRPPIYPGSIIVSCAKCGTPTYQGPRIQEAAAANPDLMFCWHWCTLETMRAEIAGGADAEVTSADMGNEYQAKR